MIGAFLSRFAIFYKTGWVESSEITSDHDGSVLVLIWAMLIAFVNYYLLNLTVAALCLAFSESMEEERKLCATPAKATEEAEEQEVDDEVSVLGGFRGVGRCFPVYAGVNYTIKRFVRCEGDDKSRYRTRMTTNRTSRDSLSRKGCGRRFRTRSTRR